MRRKEKKYYHIRTDLFWGIAICICTLIVGSILLRYKDNFLTSTFEKSNYPNQVKVTFEQLKSNLSDISECYLCGNSDQSLMGYYRKFDTIGLISLNDWYVLDFPVKEYDEKGNKIINSTCTNSLYGNTGEIVYSSNSTPSRGMAKIDITFPENCKLKENTLTDHLCQKCLDKVVSSLKYWKKKNEDSKPIPICLIDFKTMEIYSLQNHCCSYFIRDYYIEMKFNENIVETRAFYLPGR